MMTNEMYHDILSSVDKRCVEDNVASVKLATLFEMVDMKLNIAKCEADAIAYVEHADDIDRDFLYIEASDVANRSRQNIFQKAWDFITGLFKKIREHLTNIFKTKKNVPNTEKMVIPERYGADPSIVSNIQNIGKSIPNKISNRKGLVACGLALLAGIAALSVKLGSKKSDSGKAMNASDVETRIIGPVNEAISNLETGMDTLKKANDELDPNQTDDTPNSGKAEVAVTNSSNMPAEKSIKNADGGATDGFKGKTNGSIIGTITSKITWLLNKIKSIVDYISELFLKVTGRAAKGTNLEETSNNNQIEGENQKALPDKNTSDENK